MQITKINELDTLKEEQSSFFIYFSAPNCGVCTALRPKLTEMLIEEFPKLKACNVNTANSPEIAAQLGLFTNPSLVVFIQGQEVLRRSRAIGVEEVQKSLERPYKLVFGE